MSSPSKGSFTQSLSKLQEALADACARSGRDRDAVTLVGVSKRHPTRAIIEAHQWGLVDFGENYVQEWQAKADELQGLALRWHFVGTVQRNKVRFLAGRTHLIHSVDSLPLAREIGKRSTAMETIQDVLLQVSVAGEEGKGGVAPEELDALYEACLGIRGLRVRGLMVFPPFADEAESNRPYFAMGKLLLKKLQVEYPESAHNLTELSMGMSGDFDVAISEGATIIRVGTMIFGPRPT